MIAPSLRAAVLLVVVLTPALAPAQSLGTYRWQMQPYCNVVSLVVTPTGGVFTLDGFDDQCGAATRAPVTGTAVPNPNGTIELGLTIVSSPGAAPVHVAVPLNVTTLGGPWQDTAGNTGTLLFNPTAPAGVPRPAARALTQFPSGLFAGLTTLLPDGAIVAGGATGSPIPASDAGTRLMWHPGKAAIRAGRVSGAQWNDDSIGFGSVAFGIDTLASGLNSLAAGHSTRALGPGAVAMGQDSVASGANSLAFGIANSASGLASVAMGRTVSANGLTSVALGFHAIAAGIGSFAFGDRSTLNNVTAEANEFVVRAAGGARFLTNAEMTTGARLADGGGSWVAMSDVNRKENFRELDGAAILDKLARMPIREWNYTSQDAAIRHAGPTAQDFRAAFGLGDDPLGINTTDADGIALRAIQALVEENRVLKAMLDELGARLDLLESKK